MYQGKEEGTKNLVSRFRNLKKKNNYNNIKKMKHEIQKVGKKQYGNVYKDLILIFKAILVSKHFSYDS